MSGHNERRLLIVVGKVDEAPRLGLNVNVGTVVHVGVVVGFV